MKANMPFKTQPIRNMKTGREDTKKRTPRLMNVKSYNLDALVEFALDNNYIEGDKYEPRLRGSVDAVKRQLAADNQIIVGVTAKVTFADGATLTHSATIADA